jgi:hypothetical protein
LTRWCLLWRNASHDGLKHAGQCLALAFGVTQWTNARTVHQAASKATVHVAALKAIAGRIKAAAINHIARKPHWAGSHVWLAAITGADWPEYGVRCRRKNAAALKARARLSTAAAVKHISQRGYRFAVVAVVSKAEHGYLQKHCVYLTKPYTN